MNYGQYIVNSLALSVLALSLAACKAPQTIAPSQKLGVGVINNVAPPPINNQQNQPGYIVDRKNYNVTVRTILNIPICKGQISLEIKSDFSFGLPQPKISCVGMDMSSHLNLGDMLGGLTGGGNNQNPAAPLSSQAITFNHMLMLSKVGNYNYSPALPILLSPFTLSEEQRRTFEHTQHVMVAGDGASASGYVKLKVTSSGQQYRGPYTREQFNDVIVWERTTAGFPEEIKVKALLFDKLEMHWNMPSINSSDSSLNQTIAIPKILLQGSLHSFLGTQVKLPGIAGIIANIATSKLKIELDLMD